jgi:LacI family transcriptional regulator
MYAALTDNGRMTRSRFSRRVTARDVAHAVGCSVASVSLVINGKAEGRVRVETQEAVWRAVADLGYRVNTTASALARGMSSGVGFVSPDPTNPFFSIVLEGLNAALGGKYALTLLIPDRGSDYDRETVRRALSADLAGLVLASPSPRLLDDLVITCPTVLIDAGGPQAGVASIDIELGQAMVDLADHLVGFGHRSVGYIGFSREKASVQGRRIALAKALADRGAVLVSDPIELNELTEWAAQHAFETRWPELSANGVTAMVCGDELFAYGILRGCAELGVSVPEQLSVVGFNNLSFSSLIQPSLTSIDLSAVEIGRRAGASLRRFIEEGEEPAGQTVSATLVPRASTGPAANTGPAAKTGQLKSR